MKSDKTNSKKSECAKEPIEQPAFRSELPVRYYMQKVVLNIGGKRFEVRHRAEVRELRRDPANVIEMPKRPA